MNDIASIAALVFGFALACVIAVVYLLSKRQINVTQVNHTEPHIAVGNSTEPGGSGRIGRFVVKWSFLFIVAGIIIAAVANSIAGAGRSIATVIDAGQTTTAVQISAPTVAIVPTVEKYQPAPTPVKATESVNSLQNIVVIVLSVINVSLWGSIAATVVKRRRRMPPLSVSREQCEREQHLEDILPDAVNQL